MGESVSGGGAGANYWPDNDGGSGAELVSGQQAGHAWQQNNEVRQQAQDEAVAAALQQLVGVRLPNGRDIRVFLGGDPANFGVSLAQLARVEMSAFDNAGYGHRAEGLGHFERVFRGYEEHGRLTCVIIAEIEEGEREPQVLVFGDYFEVGDGFARLSPVIAQAAVQWKARHAGQYPSEFIASKYVTDPTKRAAPGLLGLGGLALAASLLGLATTNSAGIFIAARTQHESQVLIRRLLPRLVPGIEMLLDQAIEGMGDGGSQAMMLAHVPHVITDER